MTYHIVWHLVGQANRLIDAGRLDDEYADYGEAALALNQWLSSYSEMSRSEDGTHWKARRSWDADLEVRVWIETGNASTDASSATSEASSI